MSGSKPNQSNVTRRLSRQAKVPPRPYRSKSIYLVAADFEEGPKRLTISHIDYERFKDPNLESEGQMLDVIHFKEIEKRLILRHNVAKVLADIYGGDDMNNWFGKPVELYSSPTNKGPGIRARIPIETGDEDEDEDEEEDDEDEDEEEDDEDELIAVAAKAVAGAYDISQKSIRELVNQGKIRRIQVQHHSGDYSEAFYIDKRQTLKLLKEMGYTKNSRSKI